MKFVLDLEPNDVENISACLLLVSKMPNVNKNAMIYLLQLDSKIEEQAAKGLEDARLAASTDLDKPD